MKTTNFIFFKNTPLTDFMNTIHFTSNSERDAHFLTGGHYPKIDYSSDSFNFVKQKSTIRIRNSGLTYTDFDGVNYCTFLYGFDNKRYYAYVDTIKYINDTCTEINLLIDGIMTFTQGNVLSGISGVSIERQHLQRANYESMLLKLRTNTDILETTTKRYIHQDAFTFKEFHCIFTCSSDLSINPGTQDDFNINTSIGQVYDKILSPLNIYVISRENFKSMMNKLKSYPWLTQNIKSVIIFPSDLLDKSQLEDVPSYLSLTGLQKFVDNGTSNWTTFDTTNVNMTYNDLYDKHGLDPVNDQHLLRNGYTTIELYPWDGQSATYDPAFLDPDRGLYMMFKLCIGYHNEIVFYCDRYMTDREKEPGTSSDGVVLARGSFLNNALILKDFDEVPVLVDNAILSRAQNANQRALAEEMLISGRINNILDPNANLQDRFYDAASVLSNLNPFNLLGKFSDEHEFYRRQKAEFADAELKSPSLSNQSNSSSFSIANNIFGITLKISSPDAVEWNKIKKYYKLFGHEVNDDYGTTDIVNSMTIANYLMFSGQWHIPGVNNTIMEQIRLVCENGLRLWHADGSADPTSNNIMNNVFR